MKDNNLDIDKYRKKNSSRHHYIPQFLIEGFTNLDGVVYVYDKKRNKIHNKTKSPKAIFFERDRNTIDLPDNKQSSILEDLLFREIDEIGSKIVKYYKETEMSEVEIKYDNTAHFLVFLISLFWRIPLTDFAVNDIIERADIQAEGIDPEILRNDSNFKKTQRGGIIVHTINEVIKSSSYAGKFINLYQMPNELFVLGDNPLLFRKKSTKFSEFGKNDFLMAISSRRIYSSLTRGLVSFTNYNAFKYDAAIINQSLRYVCCSNLDTLEKSVKIYNEYCKNGLNHILSESTFSDKK